MKAARFHACGDIRVDEVPEPAVRPGTVAVEVGAGVDRLAVGDRVAVEPYIVCGRCDACSQGLQLDDIVDKGFRELVDNKEENVKILVRP